MQTVGKRKSWRQTIAAGLHVSGVILADDPTTRHDQSSLSQTVAKPPTYSARKQGPVGAAGAMVVEGMVHQEDDGCMRLGRHPKMRAIPRYRDPVRWPTKLATTDNKDEASSEAQGAVATSTALPS